MTWRYKELSRNAATVIENWTPRSEKFFLWSFSFSSVYLRTCMLLDGGLFMAFGPLYMKALESVSDILPGSISSGFQSCCFCRFELARQPEITPDSLLNFERIKYVRCQWAVEEPRLWVELVHLDKGANSSGVFTCRAGTEVLLWMLWHRLFQEKFSVFLCLIETSWIKIVFSFIIRLD